jgi:penicillin-binding protein 2
MARVVDVGGSAPSAHLPGIDFAGKTGSAQLISLAKRKALGAKGNQFKQNGWFVGVTPRRNPDIVVAILFEGGEHGKLAARLVAPIIKAFVDKQRRVRHDNNYAAVDHEGNPIELSGIWSDGNDKHQDKDGDSDRMQAGTFRLNSTASALSPARSAGLRRPAKASDAKISAQEGQSSELSATYEAMALPSPDEGIRRSGTQGLPAIAPQVH